MKRMLIGLAAIVLALTATAPPAAASAGVQTYTVVHNVADQNMQGICHTSGPHGGVSFEYCLYVGVSNEAGSANSYNFDRYYVSAWCKTASGNVRCSNIDMSFRVSSFSGAINTYYLYCSGNCAAASTHNTTGWEPAGSDFTTTPGTRLCSIHNVQNLASTTTFNGGNGVADIATSPWKVCDNG